MNREKRMRWRLALDLTSGDLLRAHRVLQLPLFNVAFGGAKAMRAQSTKRITTQQRRAA